MPVDHRKMLAIYFSGDGDEALAAMLLCWIKEDPKNAEAFARYAVDQKILERALKERENNKLAGLAWNELVEGERGSQSAGFSVGSLVNGGVADTGGSGLEPSGLLASRPHASADIGEDVLRRREQRYHVTVWAGVAATFLLAAFLVVQIVGAWQGQNARSLTRDEAGDNRSLSIRKAARLEGIDSAVWGDGRQIKPGSVINPGGYSLVQGMAKIRLGDGALLNIEAPAKFSIEGPGSLFLASGQAVAYCGQDAIGFMVTTPHGRFVDLGTEFGIIVDEEMQRTELHVFDGEVEATPMTEIHGFRQPVIVRSAEAVFVSGDSPITRIASGADSETFLTTRRVEVEVWDTGERTRQDRSDAAWEITQNKQQPYEYYRSAVILENVDEYGDYLGKPAPEDKYSWITYPSDSLPSRDNWGGVTFRTSFDLMGLDPSATEMFFSFVACQKVEAILLNGLHINPPTQNPTPPFVQMKEVVITGGFVSGVNRLEVIVVPPRDATSGVNLLPPAALLANIRVVSQREWK